MKINSFLFVAGISLTIGLTTAETGLAQSNSFYSQPLLPLVSKMPLPPSNTQEALQLGTISLRNNDFASDFVLPAPSISELKAFTLQLKEEIKTTAEILSFNDGPTSSLEADLIQQILAPEFRRNFEHLDEKKKFELKVQIREVVEAAAAENAMAPEDEKEEVVEALRRLGGITAELKEKFTGANYSRNVKEKFSIVKQNIRKKRQELSEWEEQEINKLSASKIPYATDSAYLLEKVREIKLMAVQKELKYVDQQLKRFRVDWENHFQVVEKVIISFDRELSGIGYFHNVRNNLSKTVIMGCQTQLLTDIVSLTEAVEEIVVLYGDLELQKEFLEKANILELEAHVQTIAPKN